MPDFVLNRNYALRSTSGHMINFVKGQPTYVPPACVKEAVALGAEAADGSSTDVLGPEEAERVVLTPAQRQEAMFKAFAEMEKRDTRGDFNAQGLPNVKVIETLTGFLPLSQERNEAFQAYREAKDA